MSDKEAIDPGPPWLFRFNHHEVLTISEQFSMMIMDIVKDKRYSLNEVVALLSRICVKTMIDYYFDKPDYKAGTFWFLKAKFLQAIENVLDEGVDFVNSKEEGESNVE